MYQDGRYIIRDEILDPNHWTNREKRRREAEIKEIQQHRDQKTFKLREEAFRKKMEKLKKEVIDEMKSVVRRPDNGKSIPPREMNRVILQITGLINDYNKLEEHLTSSQESQDNPKLAEPEKIEKNEDRVHRDRNRGAPEQQEQVPRKFDRGAPEIQHESKQEEKEKRSRSSERANCAAPVAHLRGDSADRRLREFDNEQRRQKLELEELRRKRDANDNFIESTKKEFNSSSFKKAPSSNGYAPNEPIQSSSSSSRFPQGAAPNASSYPSSRSSLRMESGTWRNEQNLPDVHSEEHQSTSGAPQCSRSFQFAPRNERSSPKAWRNEHPEPKYRENWSSFTAHQDRGESSNFQKCTGQISRSSASSSTNCWSPAPAHPDFQRAPQFAQSSWSPSPAQRSMSPRRNFSGIGEQKVEVFRNHNYYEEEEKGPFVDDEKLDDPPSHEEHLELRAPPPPPPPRGNSSDEDYFDRNQECRVLKKKKRSRGRWREGRKWK